MYCNHIIAISSGRFFVPETVILAPLTVQSTPFYLYLVFAYVL